MRMALHYCGRSNLDKPRSRSKLLNVRRSTVTHTSLKSTDQLVDIFCERSFVGHATFHAFRHQLVRLSLRLLSVSFGRSALDHRAQGAHAAIGFEATPLVDDHFART